MKVIVCNTPGSLTYEEREKPTVEKGFSLIRVRRIGVCGTDLHAFDGTQPYFTYPRILGHEIAAEFIDGAADGFTSGDLVTVIPYISCGICIACKKGKTNCCSSLNVLGVHSDGAMAEYFLVPSSLLVKSQGLPIDELALIEPLSIGCHAVGRAEINPGDDVLVVGAGPIGIGIIQYARLAGARVIVMDSNAHRLDFVKEVLGIPDSINVATQNASEVLSTMTNASMASIVFDATGNLTAINNSFRYMAHAGKYVLVGLQLEAISFSHPEFHKREATLMSSRNATRVDFEKVIHSITNGSIIPNAMITHKLAFDSVVSDFSSLTQSGQHVIKALINID